MCSVADPTMASTGFTAFPRSQNNDTIAFDSDAANAAAYNSDSAVLLSMLCCLRAWAFKHVIADQNDACASFFLQTSPVRVGIRRHLESPATAEDLSPLPFTSQIPDSPHSTWQSPEVWSFDIRWRSSFTMLDISARP